MSTPKTRAEARAQRTPNRWFLSLIKEALSHPVERVTRCHTLVERHRLAVSPGSAASIQVLAGFIVQRSGNRLIHARDCHAHDSRPSGRGTR